VPLSPTLLPRHRFMVFRCVFWLIMIGALVYNLPGWIQQFQIFHGWPPLALTITDCTTLVVILFAISVGAWFEAQLARLPGDQVSRSLYRAIEAIAVQHADGDELIDHADETNRTYLACERTNVRLGFFRMSTSDIDRPLWEGDLGYSAAERIRLLPKVGAIQIRPIGKESVRAADGTLRHLPSKSQPDGWRAVLFQARTGAGIATHRDMAELLAQLQRATPPGL
jgi:hypothetical protein